MVLRVVSLVAVFMALSGCGPEQARITETKEMTEQRRADMEAAKKRRGGAPPGMGGGMASKHWDKSNPKIAKLLEQRQQMILRYPVPWTAGLTLEQATAAAKGRLAAAKEGASTKEDQETLATLEKTRKALEENSLTYTINTTIHLESKQLKIEKAGIDSSLDDNTEVKEKMYFKSEKSKQDYLDRSNENLKRLNEYKKQLEEIEVQLDAASK